MSLCWCLIVMTFRVDKVTMLVADKDDLKSSQGHVHDLQSGQGQCVDGPDG